MSNADEQGVQIDLLLIRADGVANIIECKFTNKPFVINKKYASELENKITVFNEQTNYKFMTNIVMFTLNGVKENEYTGYLLGDDLLIGDIV